MRKRRRESRQAGTGKANASEPPLKRRETETASEPGPQCRSREEPGGLPVVLARRCPACRWREPGLRLACGNTGRRVLTLRPWWGERERERAKRQEPRGAEYRRGTRRRTGP